MIIGQVKLSNSDGRLITLPSDRFEKVDNHWKTKGK
jgi:hypothetical protein